MVAPREPAETLELDEPMTIELCNALASCGEADGLSSDLMLRVGRYAEARFGRRPALLIAAARMYLHSPEPRRALTLLLRAGKLDPEEPRLRPLLQRALAQLGDPRTV